MTVSEGAGLRNRSQVLALLPLCPPRLSTKHRHHINTAPAARTKQRSLGALTQQELINLFLTGLVAGSQNQRVGRVGA